MVLKLFYDLKNLKNSTETLSRLYLGGLKHDYNEKIFAGFTYAYHIALPKGARRWISIEY